jgi:hypothetical protein
LQSVDRVEVSGKIGPRQLLGGWLTAQLRLAPHQVHLTDSQHVEVRIVGRQGDRTGTFEVGRGNTGRAVTARAVISGGAAGEESSPDGPQPIFLAEDPLATSLADALTHLQPDVIWERALSAATSLAV